MRLYHATPARNRASIKRRGLLTAMSKGARKVVWLHPKSRRTWAIAHTMQRHGAREVIVFTVNAARKSLRRASNGLWYSTVDVEPDRLSID
jgi:RNA:NAD 2'-phosphotransferase (TPT1/KptA family)